MLIESPSASRLNSTDTRLTGPALRSTGSPAIQDLKLAGIDAIRMTASRLEREPDQIAKVGRRCSNEGVAHFACSISAAPVLCGRISLRYTADLRPQPWCCSWLDMSH